MISRIPASASDANSEIEVEHRALCGRPGEVGSQRRDPIQRWYLQGHSQDSITATRTTLGEGSSSDCARIVAKVISPGYVRLLVKAAGFASGELPEASTEAGSICHKLQLARHFTPRSTKFAGGKFVSARGVYGREPHPFPQIRHANQFAVHGAGSMALLRSTISLLQAPPSWKN